MLSCLSLAGLTGVFILAFLWMSLNSSMIADDWAYYTDLTDYGGVLGYVQFHFVGLNGRFSQAFIVQAFYALFDKSAVVIFPFFFFIGISLCLGMLMIQWLPKARLSRFIYLCAGVVLTSCGIFLSPSVLDSMFWFTSSSVYFGGILLFLIVLVVAGMVVKQQIKFWIGTIVASVFAFMAGGHAEPLAFANLIFIACVFLIVLLNAKWRQAGLFFCLTLCSGIGFLVSFFSPGTALRKRNLGLTAYKSVDAAIEDGYKATINLFEQAESWAYVIIVFLTLVLYVLIGKQSLNKLHNGLLTFLAFAVFMIFAICYMSVTLAPVGSGYALRTASIPMFATGITLFLLCFAACGLVSFFRFEKVRQGIIVFGIVACLALGALPAFHGLKIFGLAMQTRHEMIAQREISVRQQISEQRKTITVVGVPALVRSEGVDLVAPKSNNEYWMLKPVTRILGISEDQDMIILNAPETYCLTSSAKIVVRKCK